MRGFEQGASRTRRIITQFHRPAELKLKRMCRSRIAPVCSHRTDGSFCIFGDRGRALWITGEVADNSQSDGTGTAGGASAHSGFLTMPFAPSLCGGIPAGRWLFCAYFGENNAFPAIRIDDF